MAVGTVLLAQSLQRRQAQYKDRFWAFSSCSPHPIGHPLVCGFQSLKSNPGKGHPPGHPVGLPSAPNGRSAMSNPHGQGFVWNVSSQHIPCVTTTLYMEHFITRYKERKWVGTEVLFRLCCLPSHPSGLTLLEGMVRVCRRCYDGKGGGWQAVTSCCCISSNNRGGVVGCDGLEP